MWFVMVVDVDRAPDAAGNPVDRPLAEPTVIASTEDPVVAERALSQIGADAAKGGPSMVRSTVEPLAPEVSEALETKVEEEAEAVDAILSMVRS
jgi:hypothetical protein